MSVLSSVRDYLISAPIFDATRINLDNLGDSVGGFSLDSEPSERIVTRYLDGTSKRRLVFTISSRNFFTTEIETQKANLEAFEQLADWLESQRFRGAVPQLGDGKTALSLLMTSTPYPILVDESTATARYQASCEIIYLQEVTR